jgi:hypothetical protein
MLDASGAIGWVSKAVLDFEPNCQRLLQALLSMGALRINVTMIASFY